MSEDQEQINLFSWMESAYWRGVPLNAFYWHAANGGKRHVVVAMKLKRMGVRPGVPDIIGDIPLPAKHINGHRIELKKIGGDRPTDYQREEHRKLRWLGYQVDVCYGADEAKGAIQRYLGHTGYALVLSWPQKPYTPPWNEGPET